MPKARDRGRDAPPLLLAGAGNRALAEGVAGALDLALSRAVVERFPDGEARIEVLDCVRGRDVYLIEPTGPPVNERVLEVALLADACRRAGAASITGVLPYFGYARQDRRAHGRVPIGARVVAQLLAGSGIARLVVVDLHAPAIEGFLDRPFEHLTAVPLIAQALREEAAGRDAVIVSPDLGALKLAERYAEALDLPVAVVEKFRVSGAEVRVRRVVGDVARRSPIIVDDMISTGGTIEAAVVALLDAGALPDVVVAATHGLLVGPAARRLAALPIRRVVLSNTLAVETPLAVRRVDVAPLLAEAIRRLRAGDSLGDLRRSE